MKWNDKTIPALPTVMYLFYDDQLGLEFYAYGDTVEPYTYYRELTEEEKKHYNQS